MSNGKEKIEARRDELEGLANSDNPAAWVAETLLECVDDE